MELVKKVFGYIWGSKEPEEAPTAWLQFAEELKEEEGESQSRKELMKGIVTSLADTYGLIDDKLYFSYPVPNLRIKVGNCVSFFVHRVGGNGELKVSAISSVMEDCWDEDAMVSGAEPEEAPESVGNRTVMVKVTEVRGNIVSVIHSSLSTEINLSEVSLPFKPVRGDWLQIDATTENGADREILRYVKIHSAKAMRSKTVHGTVTLSNIGYGIIDNMIHFQRSVCVKGYVPKLQDVVKVSAVESCQGNCSWRAIEVSADNNRKKQMQKSFDDKAGLGSKSELLKDKKGIIIPQGLLDFGTLKLGTKSFLDLQVQNTADNGKVLKEAKFLSPGSHSQFTIHSENGDCRYIFVPPNTELCLKVQCKSTTLGISQDMCVFDFGEFKIGREVKVKVTNICEQSMKPQTSFQRYQQPRLARIADAKIMTNARKIPGERVFLNSFIIPRRLPQFPIPSALWELDVDSEDKFNRAALKLFPALNMELSPESFVDKFDALLYLEEFELILKVREYDMCQVSFEKKGEYLSLVVPGLAERRPSLMVGDSILAMNPYTGNERPYEGCIHNVFCTEIHLKFAKAFHESYNGEVYDVAFELSRTHFRRLHQGVNLFLDHLAEEILFPSDINVRMPRIVFTEREAGEDGASLGEPSENAEVKKLEPKLLHACPTKVRGHGNKPPLPPTLNFKARNGNFFMPMVNGPMIKNESAAEDRPMDQTSAAPGSQPQDPTLKTNLASNAPKRLNNIHMRNYKDLMVPRKINRKSMKSVTPLTWIAKNLNAEQKSAVRRILRAEARPLPYIIYGPPGTGKTVTLIEAVLQSYKLISDSRILVVTPSNSSADLVVTRLHRSGCLQMGDMVRLNAFRRNMDTLTEEILPYCSNGDDLELVVRYRIIITTCTASGAIYSLGLKYGHFTHVFLDEAGYANEPEALVPIGLLSSTLGEGQIILAGDPKQLGPVLMSNLAKKRGLQKSFLERLSENKLYARDETKYANHGCYDPFLVTKLVKNYRSHPDLLKLPSKLFYEDELVPCSNLSEWNHIYELDWLPKKGVPIVFHGLQGENFQEGDSPSWFNPCEVFYVVTYLRSLYKAGLNPDDVGIITPYRKQVEKIRSLLDKFGLEKPKIGSVEEFQGQERVAIILSTVRSVQHQVENDLVFRLGFLFNPKRFNVALTRAQVLLIVLGNPHVLAIDPYWVEFLKYGMEMGFCTGCNMPTSIFSPVSEVSTSDI